MLPTPAPPFHPPGLIYEEKYDGWRCLAYKRGGLVRLLSRNGIDNSGRFRALAAATASLPASTLFLDGEGAAFGEQLVSRRPSRHPDPHALVTPPIYIAFDCVHQTLDDFSPRPECVIAQIASAGMRRPTPAFPGAPPASARPRSVGGGPAARLRGAGGEGRVLRLSQSPDPVLAQG